MLKKDILVVKDNDPDDTSDSEDDADEIPDDDELEELFEDKKV